MSCGRNEVVGGSRVRVPGKGWDVSLQREAGARSEEASSHKESVLGHPWEGLSQRMM